MNFIQNTYGELPNERVYLLQGVKGAKFLHGQLTNSIADLNVGFGNENLLLSNKGKIQAGAFVGRRENDFVLLLNSLSEEVLIPHLAKFGKLSGVILAPQKDLIIYHVVWVLDDLFHSYEIGQRIEWKNHESIFEGWRTDRFGVRGIDFLVPENLKDNFLSLLRGQSLTEASEDDFKVTRIQKKSPVVLVDGTSDHLPQEAGFFKTLHFDKGCYLGQEVVARLHYRGHANRELYCLMSDVAFCSGQDVLSEEKVIGQISSSAQDKVDHKFYGLAVLPHKIINENKSLFVNSNPVQICKNE